MSNDTTASFSQLAPLGTLATASLNAGFVRGSPFHGLPQVVLDDVESVELSRGESTSLQQAATAVTIRLADRWASSPHLRLYRKEGDWHLEDAGSKNGCYVNGARTQACELMDGDVIELGASVFVFREGTRRAISSEARHTALPRTNSALLGSIYEELAAVANSRLPILISGKTGTGKEVAATLVHSLSQRRGPFYPVNCAAIPTAIAESFLFGHKRGAFTNAAADHEGVIRAAEGGTLFLDEVAELEPMVQAKLLRVLQEGLVTPMGGTRAVAVDVRVVSATLGTLDDLVEQGRFRQDLLARLSGHRVSLPELCQRKEDLGVLVEQLLSRRLREQAREIVFDRAALRAFYAHSWPNNVRELDQILHKCALRVGPVTAEHLPAELREAKFSEERPSVPPLANEPALLDALTKLMVQHRGNVSAVARDMKRARVQIRRWCRRFQLDPTHYRGD